MSSYARAALLAGLVLVVVAAPVVFFRSLYAHSKRLRQVDPGRVYRSGQLTAQGFADAVARHEEELSRLLVEGLREIDGVELLRLWEDSCESVGIVTFTVAGYEPAEVAAYLSAEHGIGVRDGRFCAHPLLARVGRAGGAVRASLGLGSSSADVERLVGAVRRLVEHGPSWTYAKTDGLWGPSPETRPGLAAEGAGASECV